MAPSRSRPGPPLATRAGRDDERRELGRRAWHVAVLASFAVAQPLFDLLGRAPDFLLAHDLGSAEIAFLIVALGGVVPALGWLIVRGTGALHAGTGRAVGTTFVLCLLAIIALALLRPLEALHEWSRVALSVAVAAGITAVYVRAAGFRRFVTWLTPGLVVFPSLFLLRPGVSSLLWPAEAAIGEASTATTPVVLVVFDSLPLTALLDERGLIDGRLYPAFAEFASQSTWYRNATTVSDYTRWALPPIVTGRYPVASALPTSSDYPNSLFTLLGGSHDFRVHEPITRLCPPTLCEHDDGAIVEDMVDFAGTLGVVYLHAVLPEEFEPGLPAIDRGWADEEPPVVPGELWLAEGEEGRRSRLMAFIDSIEGQEESEPAAYFVHVLLPHTPVVYFPSGQRFTTERFLPGLLEGRDRWTSDQWAADHGYRLFLLQVRYADRLLAQLMARLREVGLYDRALVVVASDHGASFRAGLPFRRVTDETFMDILPVPLLIKEPGQEHGVVSDRNLETIDVLPTIASMLGIEVPWSVDGSPDGLAPRPGKSVFHDDARQVRTFGASLLEETFASARRRLALFGAPETNPYQVPRSSPFHELIGRQVGDLRSTDDPGALEFELRSRSSFDAVDLEGRLPPVYLAGRARWRNQERPASLAVAVNGTIRATTRTFQVEERRSFDSWAVVLGLDALRQGTNTVEIFAIDPTAQGTLLRRAYRSRPPQDAGQGRAAFDRAPRRAPAGASAISRMITGRSVADHSTS